MLSYVANLTIEGAILPHFKWFLHKNWHLKSKSLCGKSCLLIAKLDFVQVCGLSLNFYNNTLRRFYKFSDNQQTWTSPTSADNITSLKCAKECLRPKKKKSLIALSPLKKNGSVGGIFFFYYLFFFFINTIFECKMRPEFLMKVS